MSRSTLFESFLKINKLRNTTVSGGKKLLLILIATFSFANFSNAQLPCYNNDITTNIIEVKHPNCPNNNGSIKLAVAGYVGSYNVTLMYMVSGNLIPYPSAPVLTNQTSGIIFFENLGPGYFCFFIESSNGCMNRDIELTCIPCPTITGSIVAGTINCLGATTTLTVTANGGTAPYQYSLDGGPYQLSNEFTVGSGIYTITIKDANGCTVVLNPVTVPPGANCSTTICTYTQGYYGNKSGKSCDGDGNKISTTQQILNGLNAWGGTMTLGNAARNVTVSVSEVEKVIAYLPGGESSYGFTHNGTMTLSSNTFKNTYLDNGKKRINSQLLGQTLVLGLNLKGMNSALWNVPFNDNTKAYSINISAAVYNALTTKNVGGLWQLANEALAGNVPAGLTLSMISDAVDKVNNAYNGCITVNGNSAIPFSCDDDNDSGGKGKNKNNVAANNATEEKIEALSTKLAVTASPNPYRDNIRFIIETNVSGRAVLEVYNVLGMKVATAFEGNMQAGETQVVNYKATPVKGGGLYYVLRIGDQQVTGKLISAQQ